MNKELRPPSLSPSWTKLSIFAAVWFAALWSFVITMRSVVPAQDPISIASVTKVDNLDAQNEVLARGHIRLTSPTGAEIVSATGDPNGTVTAPRGSVFLRTDTGAQYKNTNGATAWTTDISTIPGTVGGSCFIGAFVTQVDADGTAHCNYNMPTNTCLAGQAITSTDVFGNAVCSAFFNAAGDHLSSSGSTVSLAQIATARILGRTSAGPGNVEDLTGTQVTAMLDTFTSLLKGLVPASGGGTTAFLRADGNWSVPPGTGGVADGNYGDITVSGGATTWTINTNVVTYAKMQDVSATSRFLGRISAGPGDTEELTGTQATSLLNTFTSVLNGLVPFSGGGTANYLRADGTWNAPPGAVTQNVYELANTGATWNKPTGAKVVEVTVIGAGGGGGGGKQGAAGANRTGGGGGGGANVAHAFFYGTDAPSSAVITVGAGGSVGTGGAGPSSGGPGGASDFGSRLVAFGGGGGQLGQTGAVTVAGGGGGGGGGGVGGVGSGTGNNGGSPACTVALCIDFQGASGGLSPPGIAEWGGAGGGRSNFGVGAGASGGSPSLYGGGGGGGGSQVNSSNNCEASARGGGSGTTVGATSSGGGAGGAANNNGNNGTAFGPYAGGGGGGGGCGATGTAGNGGTGYIGGGGGGGGAAGATGTAGNGGAGGDGRVIVTVYF